jgi:hypothetical protein
LLAKLTGFCLMERKKKNYVMFLAPKQPSTEKNGNQSAWQPVSIGSDHAKFFFCWDDVIIASAAHEIGIT